MKKRILMVGAGGAGMAPLAMYLRGAGHIVTAFDDNFRQSVRELLLASRVIVVDQPNSAADFDEVIYSSAVKKDHPLLSAFNRGDAIALPRGQALAGTMVDKKLVAVVGSHGKTTTTAMLVHLLAYTDLSFDYLVGGFFQESGVPPARCTGADWVVAEVDESDGTIEDFRPEITLALNCDLDHVDQYGDLDELSAAFGRLFERTRGKVLVPCGHALEDLARSTATCEVETFGKCGDFDAVVEESADSLNVRYSVQQKGMLETIRAVGEFNGWNAIAALTACQAISSQIPFGKLKSFPGLLRRQIVLRETASRVIVEDYAHHPTELGAILKSYRLQFPNREMRVVFQPHRFSRQASLGALFADALSVSDHLYLLPTYSAGESSNEKGQVDSLLDLLPTHLSNTKIYDDFGQMSKEIGSSTDLPDCVLFLGAGDIDAYAAAFAHLEATGGDRWLACSRFLERRLSTDAVFRLNEPLLEKTTLRVGGKARIYCEPSGADDLSELVFAARLFDMPIVALGRGSNLIVSSEGFDGIVLCMRGQAWRAIDAAPDGRLVVGAGVRLKEICLFACSLGMAGFEFLEGIPGTLGGALRMNAGAMGGVIFDLVESIAFMTNSGERCEVSRENFHAGYRECAELKEAFVLSATLRARSSEPEHRILDRIRGFAKARSETQPREASAGCIFRNPKGMSAGRLIDEEGLKGVSVGAAQVSRKHGNFIVNRGGAKAEDVLSLIRLVRHRVKEARGIELYPEVTLLGKSWEEALKTSL